MNKNNMSAEELFDKLKSVGLDREISPFLLKGVDAHTENDELGGYLALEELKEFLKNKLPLLEQEISAWAKGGMRSYTKDEIVAYEQSKILIDLFESTGASVEKMREYWLLHNLMQHKTIKESKLLDSKNDETEVFDKVVAKIAKGDGDVDDMNFIKEIEKRLGMKIAEYFK